MKYVPFIIFALFANTSFSETLLEAINSLNGKVVEFEGNIKDDGRYRPLLFIDGTGAHHFEYSLRPSQLRDVKEVCDQDYNNYTCLIKGKAEIDTSTGRIELYIFEIDNVNDLN